MQSPTFTNEVAQQRAVAARPMSHIDQALASVAYIYARLHVACIVLALVAERYLEVFAATNDLDYIADKCGQKWTI